MTYLPTNRLAALFAIGAPLWFLVALEPGLWPVPVLYVVGLVFLAVADARRLPGPALFSAYRDLPTRLSFDQSHEVALELLNGAPKNLDVRLRDEVPDSFACDTLIHSGVLPPRGRIRVTYKIQPRERGRFEYGDVVFRIQQGLRLVQREIRLRTANPVRVYPQFRTTEDYRLLARIARRHDAVRRPRRIRGVGTDFESLRPYVEGDDPRHIDWKASARSGALITRRMQVEKGQQLVILIDAGRLMSGRIGPYSRLEHAMNAAVRLSYVVQQRGDSIGLLCFSNRIEAMMPPIRGVSIMPRVLETLHSVKLNLVESDYWQVIASAMARFKRRSLVIMMTDVLDAAGSAGLINNLKRAAERHLVLCVVLSEPKVAEIAAGEVLHLDDAYRKAAACDLIRRRRLALEHMRSHGILVLETSPDQLSVGLVRKYLEIRKGDLQ